MKYILLIFFLAAVSMPEFATAQLVTCQGVDCNACSLVDMVNGIVNFLITICVVIAVVMLAVAGFKLLTSGGNSSAAQEAKGLFTNVVIGFIIVLSAWLIVDTILRIATNTGGLDAWGLVECGGQVQPVPGSPDFGGSSGGGVNASSSASSTPSGGLTASQCADDQFLKDRFGGSPVGVEAPGLRSMINCYMSNPGVLEFLDQGQVYTVDRSHPRCSLTNGNTSCGSCSHSANSMHYGRGSGQGAKAVDFNASGASERDLYERIQAAQSSCGGTLLFEGSHTHISL